MRQEILKNWLKRLENLLRNLPPDKITQNDIELLSMIKPTILAA